MRWLVASVAALSGVALACLWDSDTYAEEALTQKDVAEILKGNLGKHSRFFYEQKVAYTEALLDGGVAPPERYDDLAVAFEKLGKTDQAIAVMLKKDARYPGLYTTKANLGTFAAHQGDLRRALELLRAAVAQNPNAHFGRERYQIKAIEYLQALAQDPSLATRKELLGIDLTEPERLLRPDRRGKRKREPTALALAGIDEDVFVALAGIIRFGSGETSAHVWFSLGAALALHGDRHLALRAFFRADRLGHPLGARCAQLMTETLKDFKGVYDLARLEQEAAEGDAALRTAQAAEDGRLRAGAFLEVFGY